MRIADLSRRLGAALPGGPPHDVRPLGDGEYCRAFLVNDGLVARVARHHEADAALRREACVMPALSPRLPVPVPVPRYFGGLAAGEPGFSLHDHLPGTALTRERWERLPDEPRHELARGVGAFLRGLHDVGVEVAAGCGLAEWNPADRARELRRRLAGPDGAALGPDLLGGLRRALDRLEEACAGPAPRPAILHADLSPEHVLVEEGAHELAAVIDWGDVCLGDPARDFIFLFEDWGDEFLGLALAAYRPGDPEGFLSRIYLHDLADQLRWTLDSRREGRHVDVREGVAGLEREMEAWQA